MTNTAKILNFGRGNFAEQERNVAPNRSVMWQISMMVTPDYQIC